MRTDYRPLVEKQSKITDTQSRFTLDKKLRSANQNHLLKYETNSPKPLPRISIKRPALTESKKEIDGKRLKLSEAAHSSNVVVNDAKVDPRCSKTEQSIIIQNYQPMESSQTEKTAAASNGYESTEQMSQIQRTEQNDQALSSTVQEVDKPTEIINIDDEDHSQGVKKPDENDNMSQSHFSSNTTPVSMTATKPLTSSEHTTQPNQCDNQEHIPDSGSSLSNFQPQIENVQSLVNVHNDDKLLVKEVLSNELSTSYGKLVSLKISAHLYSHMNQGRRLVPIQKPFEKRLRPERPNTSNLMEQTRSLLRRSVEQRPMVTQNQPLNDPQTLKMHSENSKDQTAQLSSIVASSQEIHDVPRINIERSNDEAADDRENVCQCVYNVAATSQKLPNFSHERSNVLNSVRRALSTTRNNYLSNEQQLQARQSAQSAEHKNRDITTSLPNIAALAYGSGDKHNSQMPNCSFYQSSSKQHIATHENVYTSLRTQKQSVDQSTQTSSKAKRVHFNDDVAKSPVTGSYLNVAGNAYQTDEYILEATMPPYQAVTSDSVAVTDYEVISDHDMSADEPPVNTKNDVYCTGIDSGCSSADRPTIVQNPTLRNHQTHSRVILDAASNSSPSNLTPEVPESSEERRTEVMRVSASNQDQRSNDIANKTPKKKHNNLWNFVLPPEYDPNDTRWTLKYPTYMPGLVELIPQSGIYISHGDLKYCQQVSKDCKSLARRLLQEVFNRNALSVCLSMSEKSQSSNNVGSNIRPELDVHACAVLLDFVIEHGPKHDWNTALQPILSSLHIKTQEIRYKYGIMVKS